MSNWVLHIVGETIDDDLAEPIGKFVKEIQSLSHKVKQVRITTDTGEKVLHIAQDVGDVVDTVDPAAAPEVAKAEAEVDNVVTEHETTATPTTPVVETPPVSSSTPTADPTSTPVAPAPVNPPVAGASSTDSNPSSTTATPPTAIPTT